jgi:hypothetical protein
MQSLIQSQLRLTLVVIGGTLLVLGSIPLLFWLVPPTRTLSVLGLPLPWVILGGAVYPLLVLLALLYVRQAERNERDFVEFIERS